MINTTLRARQIPIFDKINLLKFQGQIGQTLQVFETSSQSGESLIGNFRGSILKRLFIIDAALALNAGGCFWSLN